MSTEAAAATRAEIKVLVPDWYARMIGHPCVSLERELAARFPTRLVRLAQRIGPLHGFLLFRAAAGADRIALPKNARGTRTFLVLEAAAGRRRDRLILLAFLVRQPPRARWRRLLYSAWFDLVERPSVRRAMRVGHVLTEWEQGEYAARYGISPERLRLVRWALSRSGAEPPPFVGDADAGVVCSGRAECDWETLFAAAHGKDWRLTVICGERDLGRVRELNRSGRAEVVCEVSRREHDEMVRSSALYVVCLEDGGPSAGHVRLAAVVDCGTPVVATRVRGLDGYVEEGRTAEVVPPGDPERLGEVIDALLGNAAKRRALREAASDRARHWTYREYFGAVRSLLVETDAN